MTNKTVSGVYRRWRVFGKKPLWQRRYMLGYGGVGTDIAEQFGGQQCTGGGAVFGTAIPFAIMCRLIAAVMFCVCNGYLCCAVAWHFAYLLGDLVLCAVLV